MLSEASRLFDAEPPNWSAAIVFYLLFVLGLLVFVILPSLETGSTRKLLVLGALFGLVTYATYDLTNLATVKDWPWVVTVVGLYSCYFGQLHKISCWPVVAVNRLGPENETDNETNS